MKINHPSFCKRLLSKQIQSFDISDDGAYRLEMREDSCCWSPYIYSELYNLTAGTNATIFPVDGNAEGGGRISPDNQKIVYTQYNEYSPPADLWIMNADGTGNTKLTSADYNIHLVNPSWNGTGTKIIYQNYNGTDASSSLHMWDVTGGTSSAFLTGSANYEAADWLH
jgi:Tol biopolymer transport system component